MRFLRTMDEEYIQDLISLVEEYKIHGEKADAQLLALRSQVSNLEDENSRWRADNAHRSSLWREMEESVVHMDQEVRTCQ